MEKNTCAGLNNPCSESIDDDCDGVIGGYDGVGVGNDDVCIYLNMCISISQLAIPWSQANLRCC